MTRHLIVARLNEPTEWLRTVTGWNVVVVQKGVQLPNVGREATSYLWVLAELGYRARDRLAFVQGDPLQHTPELASKLERRMRGFVPLSDWVTSDGADGAPNHPGLKIGERFDDWIGGQRPDAFTFPAGAQFSISGRQALSRSRDFYRDLSERVVADPDGAWIIERLWPYLWEDGRCLKQRST